MSIVAAALLLGAIEGLLRVAGYGGYPPTFRTVGTLADGSRLVFTDHGGPTSYFFANRSLPGSLDPTAFLEPKPARTFRIVVVGESAAKGNPYPRGLNWATMLGAMLSDLRPERSFEIVNLGTTAVASFPVLGLLNEALEHEPDLVIVYVGNNEFYGAYGVASLHSAGRSPAMIRFVRWSRSLAIGQLLDERIRSAPTGDPDAVLMQTMVGRSSIGVDDPARVAAARNLETFVGDMVAACARRRVPVIVCTPPANERDLAPLGAADLSALSEAQRCEVERLLGETRVLLPTDPAGAEAAARGVIGLVPNHATAHHLLGTALLGRERLEESAEAFRLAVDLDPMPWRPPSSSVEAIRRAAAKGGAVLCDLQRAFREASPGGSVGWELMDDHVHASLLGQYLIARSIVRALEGVPGELGLASGESGAVADADAMLARLGDNPYERFAAAFAMRRLAGIPFFRDTNPGFFARNDAVCRAVEASADAAVREQMNRWQEPATHTSIVRPISGMVGHAMFGTGRAAEAEPLFRVAAASVTPWGSWELEYRYMELLCRRAAGGELSESDAADVRAALERGRAILSLGESRTGATELYTGLLHQLVGQFAESVPLLETASRRLEGPNRLAPDEALVQALVRTGRTSEAAALIESRVSEGGALAPAYRRIGQRALGR